MKPDDPWMPEEPPPYAHGNAWRAVAFGVLIVVLAGFIAFMFSGCGPADPYPRAKPTPIGGRP